MALGTPTRDTRARTASIPTGTSRDPPATPLGTRLPLIRRHTPPQDPLRHHITSSPGKERETQTLRSWPYASSYRCTQQPTQATSVATHPGCVGTRNAPASGASGDRGNARRPLNNPLPEASRARPFPCVLPYFFLPSLLFLPPPFSSFLLSTHPSILISAPRPTGTHIPLYSSSPLLCTQTLALRPRLSPTATRARGRGSAKDPLTPGLQKGGPSAHQGPSGAGPGRSRGHREGTTPHPRPGGSKCHHPEVTIRDVAPRPLPGAPRTGPSRRRHLKSL